MEVMDASLEFFYRKVHEIRSRFPEDILSVVAFSVCLKFHLFFVFFVKFSGHIKTAADFLTAFLRLDN